MAKDALYPRFAEPLLEEALADNPVVLIHGPRQCGKTTLTRVTGGPRGYEYLSFDDEVVASAAAADPAGFVAELPPRVVLDEVQRAPALFAALKLVVDRQRTPGRFLLTGSANVLLVPTLSDSLAGRMEILRLFPLAQCEVADQRPRFLDRLFAASFKTKRFERLGQELAERIVAGGYPSALARATPRRRSTWYRDYVETLVQRDVRLLARIASLDALPRLMALAAGQTARLLNVADLAGPFALSRPTIRDYITLLQRVFLIDELPPWHSNREPCASARLACEVEGRPLAMAARPLGRAHRRHRGATARPLDLSRRDRLFRSACIERFLRLEAEDPNQTRIPLPFRAQRGVYLPG